MRSKNVVRFIKDFHKKVCCDHETDVRIVFHYKNIYFLSALMGITISAIIYDSELQWYRQWDFWIFIVLSYVPMFYSREQRQNYLKLKNRKK